jgi:hypothetical protein
MTHTERLARAIAQARHGTDAYWANYEAAARAAIGELHKIAAETGNREAAAMLAGIMGRG